MVNKIYKRTEKYKRIKSCIKENIYSIAEKFTTTDYECVEVKKYINF